ncbi:hypothetical protein PENTCL1PPCAC_16915, partial [Pristionchus entomophagus]
FPCTGYAAFPFDASQIETLVLTSPYNLEWIIQRGPYFIHERSQKSLENSFDIIQLVFCSFVFFMGIFFRMYVVLHRDKNKSVSTIRKIRRSLFILFIQV